MEKTSIEDKALARFGNLVKVEKDGQQISGTATQIKKVAEAQKLLDQGDVEGAIVFSGHWRLCGASNAAFIDQAQATLMAQKVQQMLGQNLVLKLKTRLVAWCVRVKGGAYMATGGDLIPWWMILNLLFRSLCLKSEFRWSVMIRTLWYLIKICLVLGLQLILRCCLAKSCWNGIFITLLYKWDFWQFHPFLFFGFGPTHRVGLPDHFFSFLFCRYRKQRRQEQGHKSFVEVFDGSGAGDHKNARYPAHRAQKLLPESESGLPLLLQAQAVREMGMLSCGWALSDVAQKYRNIFAWVTRFDSKCDYVGGGSFPRLWFWRKAFSKISEELPIVKSCLWSWKFVNRLWSDALNTLDAVKLKVIERDKAFRDRVAIYCVLGIWLWLQRVGTRRWCRLKGSGWGCFCSCLRWFVWRGFIK